ncbi:hypothetical protein ACFQPA_18080 [Halomarina halobia]|uniref:PEGA domain-containing protein n=1 Tax=Halomarina halobia TaxID=3033386 RepID=A0ABD6AD08_9EURY|nr:hypothetical protein [Halomarina sp. PSR21]
MIILIAVSAFAVWGLPALVGGDDLENGSNGTNTSNGSTGVGATPANNSSAPTTDAPATPTNGSTDDGTNGTNGTDGGDGGTETPTEEEPTATPTPTEAEEWHTLVIDGQSSSVSEYSVTVSGKLEPVRGGTGNDRVSDDGRTLNGQVTDGYDSYRFTGDVQQVQVSGKALVKVDGEVVLRSGGATDQRPDDGSDAEGTYAVRVIGGEKGTGPLVTVDGERHVVEPGETFQIPAGADRVRVEAMEYVSAKRIQFLEGGNVVAEQRLDNAELQMEWKRGDGDGNARLPGDVEVSATGPGMKSGDPVLRTTARYPTSDGTLTVATTSGQVYGQPQTVTAEVGYYGSPPDEEVTLSVRSGDRATSVTEVPEDGTVKVTLSA